MVAVFEALSTGDRTVLDDLATPDCEACTRVADVYQAALERGDTYDLAPPTLTGSFTVDSERTDDTQFWDISVHIASSTRTAADGSTYDEGAITTSYGVTTRWEGSRWAIADIKRMVDG